MLRSQWMKEHFFYFVASEASKLSEEQYHTLKGQVFNTLQNVTASNLKPATPSKAPAPAQPPTPRQAAPLPRRTATVTSDTQAMGILPPQGPTRQAAASASSSSLLYYTPITSGIWTGREQLSQPVWIFKFIGHHRSYRCQLSTSLHCVTSNTFNFPATSATATAASVASQDPSLLSALLRAPKYSKNFY